MACPGPSAASATWRSARRRDYYRSPDRKAAFFRVAQLLTAGSWTGDSRGHQENDPMPLIETEEAARRLARAIASDLSLYNEDKIVNGITNDNLFESLAEEIEEGRALYKRRVSPELYPRNFYDRALVDILIKAKGHIKSKLW
jgi:hypothetical protein